MMSHRCLLDELLPQYDVRERHQLVVAAQCPLLAQLLTGGFTLLAEEPDREVVAGVVGQM